MPLVQVVPVGQWLLQVPQLTESTCTLEQTPLHRLSPWGQTHAPALHCRPPLQAVPQALQLLGSELVSTQTLPHLVLPAAQLSAQLPETQTSPAAHALPQLPQRMGSFVTSTHWLPQSRAWRPR